MATSTLAEELDRLLDKGVISPQCTSCCPDCGNFYILASVESYLKFYDAVSPDNLPPIQEECCTNICEKELQSYSNDQDFDRFLDKGIVEYSTFNGKSFICYVVDYFKNNESALGSSSFAEVLDRILDKGIIIYCDGENQIVASVDVFIAYLENTNVEISYGEDCCISVVASIETYLTYVDGIAPTPPPL